MLLVAVYFTQNPAPVIKISILLALLLVGYLNGKITAEKSRRLARTYDIDNHIKMRDIPKRTHEEE